jgi:hypothetical protein
MLHVAAILGLAMIRHTRIDREVLLHGGWGTGRERRHARTV